MHSSVVGGVTRVTTRQANWRPRVLAGISAWVGLGMLFLGGCGVADDDLAAVLAGFGRTDVPIIVADVPRDQGEQIPDLGQDPGVDPGQDPGGPVCPQDKDCAVRECGPDPVCGLSCGTCEGSWVCELGKCRWGPDDYTVQCSGGMCIVPAGEFWQGCDASVDTVCDSDEKPYHEVNVPAFEIDKYEVTVDLYGDCVTGGGCTASTGTSSYCNQGKAGKGEHPMNCITWDQAGEYCAWAGKRLCSESEWEKASRGTDGRKYPWGNETATCDYAVMDEGGDGCGTDSTWAVGSKPAGVSPYGALDMSGNVWEWVEDDWHSNYTGAPTNGTAWVENPRASSRVARGGSFGDYVYDYHLRSSYRDYGDPAYYYGSIGARCCRSK